MTRLIVWLIVCTLSITACSETEDYVVIETEYGDLRILLYDHTPLHKENFLNLVEDGYYDDLLFHRVMSRFMIQGGDPDSRQATPGQRLGNGGPGYTIEAEIGSPHFKGVLSAARQPDHVNPEKRSSGSQFFIVQGRQVTDTELNQLEKIKGIKYSVPQRDLYKEIGGYPNLDGDYTVFGEVVSGMDVIDQIAAQQTDAADRPVEDIKMKIRRD